MQTALTDEERRSIGWMARDATIAALEALGGEAHRTDIRRHALQHGGFSPAQLAEPAVEERRDKYATLVEYRLSWALTNLKRDGLVERVGGGRWALASVELEAAGRVTDEVIDVERLAALRGMRYQSYLQTPEWRRTRAAMLKHAGGHCQLDATHVGPLEVHHNTYERKGVELTGDLVVLCAACHRRHHGKQGDAPANLTEPFVVPLDWTPPRPTSRPSLLKRLFSR